MQHITYRIVMKTLLTDVLQNVQIMTTHSRAQT